MKTILFTILLLFSNALFAGDWDLFQVDHKMYYYNLEAQAIDWFSFQTAPSNYIKSDKYEELPGAMGCPVDTFHINYFLDKSRWHMDSIVVLNHVNRYYSANPIGSFNYEKAAEVGSSWTVVALDPINDYDIITITCISKELETFMGLTDSVKTFSFTPNGSSPGQVPVSNFQMRVSKNYGVLEMVPFEQLFHHPPYTNFVSIEIIGIETPTFSAGYSPVKLADYFNYQAGQILNWELCKNNNTFSLEQLYRDSITSITYSPNGLEYFYDRRIINVLTNTQSYEYNLSWSIDFSAMTAYSAPPDWGDFQTSNLYYGFEHLFIKEQYFGLDPYSTDTIHRTKLSSTNMLLDLSNCATYFIIHSKDFQVFDSRYGLMEHCYETFAGPYRLKRVIAGPCPGIDSLVPCFVLPPYIDCDNGGVSNGIECIQGTDPFDPSDDFSVFLPIELTVFTGKLENKAVELYWKTASESNSAYFEIERSTDNTDFRKIGTLQASGTTNQPTTYQFTDDLPPTGTLYYRLKLVDLDNWFEYSNTIAIKNVQISPPLEVYPNPVKAGTTFQIITNTELQEDGLVQIFDNNGRKLLDQILLSSTKRHKIDTGELSSGIYLMVLVANGERESRKIAIH